jgi:hypothetical protein
LVTVSDEETEGLRIKLRKSMIDRLID